MKIGVPTEIKPQENRVALTPAGAERLQHAGHEVWVQSGAGLGSGFEDDDYRAVGAEIRPDAEATFDGAELILKVKEPLASEWPLIREGMTVFTYLHLAANQELTLALQETGAYCFAYETLEENGALPLLTPMSEVAGRMSVQAGAKFLEKPHGGSGILLGGVPGVKRARVLVLGGGVVGTNAARMACGLGADVTIMDLNLDRLRYLDEVMPRNCRTVYSTPLSVREHLVHADLVIGAVLIHGAAAPKLVRRRDLASMKDGTVIVDVAIDQGGCFETSRPTTHADPVFTVDGVVHYCVANMPGAVPRTSTHALTHATLAWTLRLAEMGPIRAVKESPELASAANVLGGQLVYRGVAEAFGLDWTPAEEWAAAH
ncbi:MAG TPA: alanine dehydrogenase [Planctomycetes bacterium]|nr:alanine dehydrogenase [Planctomycetota bacterium]